MSQDASTRQMSLKSPQSLPSSSPAETFSSGRVTEAGVPVESYADRLMDDLFEDVERILDGGIKTSVEPTRPSNPAPQLSHLANLVLPLAPRSQPDEGRSDDQITDLARLANSSEKPFMEIGGAKRSYDRLLLGVGCVSIVMSFAVWLASRDMKQPPLPSPSAPAAVNSNSQAQGNSSFIDYMRKSLQSIDQKVRPGSTANTSKTGQPNATMPTVAVPGSPTVGNASGASTSGAATRATGNTPIYVPVYQPPTNFKPTSKISIAPLPTLPQKAAPTAAPATVNPPIPLSVPGVARTLVGVMELGDRSAALIEINGIAQRYRVGESIGSSGWALVEVSKNQAVVRRNGEVRSIFIGQNF